ncbi:hypothetical protein [Cytobacillus oceanisediminis]|uniref:hypothetical protein n=1 Tax=Cytobacillus oceanisediminis TaxID=665099 RepID=UPI001FB53BCA|nr:hypothetical protein [Cytobacillus oceanisediminis]UOE54940.1 hypothetical protein IRB79_24720 [Cytobacillus oceanisediminis]
MLFSVDFTIECNGGFSTVHTALIHAMSVTECKSVAEDILEELPELTDQKIHIFIEH